MIVGAAGAQTPAATARPGGVVSVLSVGFDGRVRIGAWTPVWLEVTAPPAGVDGVVTVTAAAPQGSPSARFQAPVRAAGGARVRVFIPAIFYDARAPGVATLADRVGTIASVPLPRLTPVDDIIVALSSDPLGIESFPGRVERVDVVYTLPEALPETWQAYEAVRLLVVRDLDERRITEPQRRAVLEWIWSGGHLVAMPSGDDARHLRGPTLLAARQRPGRGRVVVWADDAADPSRRGRADVLQEWQDVAAERPTPASFDLEPTLAPQRPVPAAIQALVGLAAAGYILGARRVSRIASRLTPAAVLATALVVAVATVVASRVAQVARAAASGVVASAVVKGIPGTGHALVGLAARTVTARAGTYVVAARPEILLRPPQPAPVSVTRNGESTIGSHLPGLRLSGAGVVPLPIEGTYAATAGGAVISVTNRTGARLEPAWVYQAGRVQPVPAVGASARIGITDARWTPRDRLGRTEPNHLLLLWAFSHLEGDVILKKIPAWLIGWTNDPVVGLRWGDRVETTWHLILVPLATL